MQIKYSFFLIIAFLIATVGSKLVFITLISCFLHELGHLLCLFLFRAKVHSFTLSSYGFSVKSNDLHFLSNLKQLVIYSFGPLFSLFFAIFFNYIAIHGFRSYTFFTLSVVNLFLFYFNMLPINRLDGGQILGIILNCFFKNQSTLDFILSIISLITLLILLCFGVYFTTQNNYSLLIVAILLFLTEKF